MDVGGSFRSFLRNAFHGRHSQIPPTAVGEWFRSLLVRRYPLNAARAARRRIENEPIGRKDLNQPPTAVGIRRSRRCKLDRKDLKVSTPEGGILNFLCKTPATLISFHARNPT